MPRFRLCHWVRECALIVFFLAIGALHYGWVVEPRLQWFGIVAGGGLAAWEFVVHILKRRGKS
jgi:hypothetical protein